MLLPAGMSLPPHMCPETRHAAHRVLLAQDPVQNLCNGPRDDAYRHAQYADQPGRVGSDDQRIRLAGSLGNDFTCESEPTRRHVWMQQRGLLVCSLQVRGGGCGEVQHRVASADMLLLSAACG